MNYLAIRGCQSSKRQSLYNQDVTKTGTVSQLSCVLGYNADGIVQDVREYLSRSASDRMWEMISWTQITKGFSKYAHRVQ